MGFQILKIPPLEAKINHFKGQPSFAQPLPNQILLVVGEPFFDECKFLHMNLYSGPGGRGMDHQA